MLPKAEPQEIIEALESQNDFLEHSSPGYLKKPHTFRKPNSPLKGLSRIFTHLSSVFKTQQCFKNFSELNYGFQNHTQAGFLKETLGKRDMACINTPDVIAVPCA